MKEKRYKIIMSISVIIFLFFTLIQCSIHHFNSRDILNEISYLSSSEFEGRLCGSPGGKKTSDYIEEVFKTLNLTPLGENYKNTFNIITPTVNGDTPNLELEDSKGKKTKFKYGDDFKEDFLNFKKSKATVSYKDTHKSNKDSIVIKQGEDIFLFYFNQENNLDFRSSFIQDSKISFAVCLSEEAFKTISKSLEKGGKLDITLPYSLKNSYASNVSGVIKGKSDDLPPLVLTAHFDHLGVDYLGNNYGGALDNASGTAFLLEILRVLNSYPTPNRDIIFAFLDGEEFGFLGSYELSKTYKDKLKGATVINFDMIGADTENTTLMRSLKAKDKFSNLEKSLVKIAESKDISTNITFEDSSDHVPFFESGLDSLTLTNDDTSKIHTPFDTIDNLYEPSINDAYNIVFKYTLENCYLNITRLLYNETLHIASFLICLLLVGYNIQVKIRESKNNG